jgi:large subunit ribosomal protein L29
MKPKEIRELSEAEMEAKLQELRQELFHLRLQQQTARPDRPSRLHEVRRDIARVMTILKERRSRKLSAQTTAKS